MWLFYWGTPYTDNNKELHGIPGTKDAVSAATQKRETKWERASPSLLHLPVMYTEPKTLYKRLWKIPPIWVVGPLQSLIFYWGLTDRTRLVEDTQHNGLIWTKNSFVATGEQKSQGESWGGDFEGHMALESGISGFWGAESELKWLQMRVYP